MRMRVVIYSDLNALFLEQYPLPPSYFQSNVHISVLFLVQYDIYFQSNVCLFLDQNQVLDPVLFGSLAIQRKLFSDCGWILPGYLLLYKSNKEEDDNVCKLDGNVDWHICFHLLPRQQKEITKGSIQLSTFTLGGIVTTRTQSLTPRSRPTLGNTTNGFLSLIPRRVPRAASVALFLCKLFLNFFKKRLG